MAQQHCLQAQATSPSSTNSLEEEQVPQKGLLGCLIPHPAQDPVPSLT